MDMNSWDALHGLTSTTLLMGVITIRVTESKVVDVQNSAAIMDFLFEQTLDSFILTSREMEHLVGHSWRLPVPQF